MSYWLSLVVVVGTYYYVIFWKGARTMEYQIISLECWGNAKDGYEVNDAHYTGERIYICDDATDKEIIDGLKRAGFIKKGTRSKSVGIEGEPGYNLYINDVRSCVGGLLPVYELRAI